MHVQNCISFSLPYTQKKPSLESAATPKAFGVFYTCFLLKNTVDHIKGEKLGDKQKKSGINPKHYKC